MKMDKVAGSNNDEFYTPDYAIVPLLKYLNKERFKTIWCPFDTEESIFVKMFKKEGFEVIATHINNSEDFFSYKVDNMPNCDIIISNPPYSLKGQVLERLFSLCKPFAMLVGVVGLFESKHRFAMFKNNLFEILYMDKRIAYFKSYEEQKPSLNPPFSSVYVCSQLLPRKICFEEITKKTGVLKQRTLHSSENNSSSLRSSPSEDGNLIQNKRETSGVSQNAHNT